MSKLTPQQESEIQQVRAALAMRGWQLKDLAKAAGMPIGTLTNVMAGSNPYWPPREKINRALGMDIFSVPQNREFAASNKMMDAEQVVTKAGDQKMKTTSETSDALRELSGKLAALRKACAADEARKAKIAELQSNVGTLRLKAHDDDDATARFVDAKTRLELLKSQVGDTHSACVEAARAYRDAAIEFNYEVNAVADAEEDRVIAAIDPSYQIVMPKSDRYEPKTVKVLVKQRHVVQGIETKSGQEIEVTHKFEPGEQHEVTLQHYRALGRFLELQDEKFAAQIEHDAQVNLSRKMRDKFQFLHKPTVRAIRNWGIASPESSYLIWTYPQHYKTVLNPQALIWEIERFLSRVERWNAGEK